MRKGTAVPYIVHPMDTGVIVSRMTDDPEVISAALLHDVIEDAGVTKEELEERFGSRVAELVAAESEDKTRTWKERKQATIDRLTDKLSNLRSTAADYLLKGDEVWKKFRVTDKREHEWYYRGVFAKLSELSGESAYGEYRELMEMVFGQKEK